MPTLDWLNRAEAFSTSGRVPYRLLEPVSSHGTGAENLLIQGDNLEALKALLPFYRGQVKCIFIDPPYNTKSAFEHYDDNLEHSQWLSMMYPRLQLLRELLSEDGCIWVHLDDNEAHYNKVLMDEVFGRQNFIASVCWQKSYAVRSNAEFFSTSVESIAVYARQRSSLRIGKFTRSEDHLARFDNPDNDPRGRWQSITMTISLMSGARGRQFAKTGISANIFEVRSPTGKPFVPTAGRCWSRSPIEFQRLDRDGRIWWGRDGNSPPRMKMFLSESEDGVMPTTLWASGEQFGFNQDGIRELRALGLEFPTPKPERLISQVLRICTQPSDLILDSFLGSGTTAAVAHKMGRRWIGIEMGAHAATHCLPRLQKVIDGEQGGISKAVNWQGGGGFRFLTLGAPVFDESGRIHPDVCFATLAAYVWQQETGTAFDPATAAPSTPYLGTSYAIDNRPKEDEGKPVSTTRTPRMACYLLFNGILGDRRPASGNVLTRGVLAALLVLHAQVAPAGAPLVVYGESVRVGPARLAAAGVTFKQIPYDLRAR
jgi:adenine-specific DNA-methyltransferase